MQRVTDAPIRPSQVYEMIGKDKSGSVLLHYAIVRQRTGDQVTTGIEFRTHGDTKAELAGIAAEIREKWNADDVILIRRTGKLEIGDIIALVGVSCPRSKDVFEACQHGVSRLKQMLTIRKTEAYKDPSS